MTDREKAIVMAYTGTTMLAGDKFNIFHKYVEEILGHPVFTHELPSLQENIKTAAESDFITLCAGGPVEPSTILTIPNDSTNGDVIMMFLKMLSKSPLNIFNSTISLSDTHVITVDVSDRYWNAPYMRKEKKYEC